MKILNVVNIYFTLPYFLGDQLSYFTEKGNEIHLICSPSQQLHIFAKKHKCKWKEIEIKRKFSVLSDIKVVWKLFRYIRHHRFDIVSGHTPKAGMLTMFAARLAGVKKRLYFRHGLVFETSTGLKRKILVLSEKLASWCSTKTICVSTYLIEQSIKGNLTSRNKLKILNRGSCTGIDASALFNPANYNTQQQDSLRVNLNIPKDAFVVGFVGRMVRDKGIIELIDAYKDLIKQYPKFILLLVGPLEVRDGLPISLLEFIRKDKNIRYVGLVEENMPLYYSIMDLFVLPTHREGLGVSLLEAQSMGIPVLTTSHTGSRDAIQPGITGNYIAPTGKSICEHIKEYIENRDLCERHGRAGRNFILDNFRQELIWEEIEKLYLE